MDDNKLSGGFEHITLNSGHSVITTPDEVDKELYFFLQRIYRDSQRPEGVMMPDGYHFKTTVFSEGAVATVSGPSGVPILTTCGLRQDPDGALWRMLHNHYDGPLMTDPNNPPKAPYIADRLEIGSSMHMDAMEWTGGFARCFGWIVISPESVR
ncbi:hypothetical protein ACE41H_21380 [Paenibacillus enshidis]|uniref:Uncharacterized protein n=1 Tax=Paenibacillus enshidis TaxID=1458439 RepID=A0ABV5AYM4_9BACL